MYFLTIVVRNITRRWLRTALTTIAISVAIGAVVALVGVADGFESSFMDVYTGAGIEVVVVRAGVQENINSGIDAKLADEIRKVDGVTEVTLSLLDVVSFEQFGLYGVPLRGLEAGSRLMRELNVIEGRGLTPADSRGIMLGRNVAANMGKKTGDVVELYEEEDYTVVGVFESHNVFDNGSMVILLSSLQRLMDRPDQVTGFAVSVSKPDDIDFINRVAREIERHGTGLTAMNIKDHVAGITQLRVARGMAWLTSLIGLTIGSIGVLNTMFMSVVERTREIGILRAIGWRKGRVIRMIIAESILMSLIGAAVGSGLAVALTLYLSQLPVVSGVIDGRIAWHVIGEGWALALLVGIVGSAYPAYRCAQLLPTEALRHE